MIGRLISKTNRIERVSRKCCVGQRLYKVQGLYLCIRLFIAEEANKTTRNDTIVTLVIIMIIIVTRMIN